MLLIELLDLIILVSKGQLVAVQVLVLLMNSLINDGDLVEHFLLLLQVLGSFGLRECGRLFGILKLGLHVVVLLRKLLDLLCVLISVGNLLLRKLIHVLLQLQN